MLVEPTSLSDPGAVSHPRPLFWRLRVFQLLAPEWGHRRTKATRSLRERAGVRILVKNTQTDNSAKNCFGGIEIGAKWLEFFLFDRQLDEKRYVLISNPRPFRPLSAVI
jgi:hypothetical protein